MFTLIGAGAKTLEQACRPMSSLIPPETKWLQAAITKFNPEENTVETSDGKKIGYDYLIVGLGLQVNFNAVGSDFGPPRASSKWSISQFWLGVHS